MLPLGEGKAGSTSVTEGLKEVGLQEPRVEKEVPAGWLAAQGMPSVLGQQAVNTKLYLDEVAQEENRQARPHWLPPSCSSQGPGVARCRQETSS